MPSRFLSDNIFIKVFAALFPFYIISRILSGRDRIRDKRSLRALALEVEQRGWRWQDRPMSLQRPPGLEGDGERFVAWLITGTSGDHPWTLEQNRHSQQNKSLPGVTFRGLLASPLPYGMHILLERSLDITSWVPGVSGVLTRDIAAQARKVDLNSAVPADDLASILFPNAARRVPAPPALDRLGYAALVTRAGAQRASIVLEQIAPIVSDWLQANPDHSIDVLISSRELRISVRDVMMDFVEVDQLVTLGLAVLDAVSRAESE